MGEQVRRWQVPIIGGGRVEFRPLSRTPHPLQPRRSNPLPAPTTSLTTTRASSPWLPAFAPACGAPEPLRITEQEAPAASGADSVYCAMRLRGASNAKPRRTLNFVPADWSGSSYLASSTRMAPAL